MHKRRRKLGDACRIGIHLMDPISGQISQELKLATARTQDISRITKTMGAFHSGKFNQVNVHMMIRYNIPRKEDNPSGQGDQLQLRYQQDTRHDKRTGLIALKHLGNKSTSVTT